MARSRRSRPPRPPTDTQRFETPPDAEGSPTTPPPGRASRPGHTRPSEEHTGRGAPRPTSDAGRFDRFLADLTHGYAIPSKRAAMALLDRLAGA